MTFDPGDVESGLAALGVPSIVHFSALSLNDAYAQIEQLGAATGRLEAATALVGEIQAIIDDIRTSLSTPNEPLTYYHELDNTFYSVTSATFVGELYSVLGLENIADPADADGFGFPQLSPEFILEADPDLIFLADTKCCGQSAASLQERPGWDQLSAVQNGWVVELDDDIASRWGPRIIDFLETIVAAVENYQANRTD
jgi:iron complex transport system substrate-binding protein